MFQFQLLILVRLYNLKYSQLQTQNKAILSMSKLIVLIMEGNTYPFGQSDLGYNQKKKIMVRNRIQFHPQNKQTYLKKAKLLKKLVNPYLIKLEQLLEQENSIHLLYEYIPIKVETWIQNINAEFIQSFKSHLFQLSDFLAQNRLLIKFQLKNIGMNENYNPKYFIGINFDVKQNVNINNLKKQYKKQINDIFSKYTETKFAEEDNIEQVKSLRFIEQKSNKQENQVSLNLHHKSSKQFSEQKPKKSLNIFSSLQCKKRVVTQTRQIKNEQQQINSIKKTTSMGENQMKQTLRTNKKLLKTNTNIKIENLGQKINNIRMMLQNMNDQNSKAIQKQRSTSPMITSNKVKVNTKLLLLKKKSGDKSLNSSKCDDSNENWQSKNQIQFDKRSERSNNSRQCLHQISKQDSYKNLMVNVSKINKQKIQQPTNQNIHNYYDEFLKILEDEDDSNPEIKYNKEEVGSPFSTSESSASKFQHFKPERQQLDRKSYPRLIKPIGQRNSQTSNDGQIQCRISAAINTSKKLISSIRKNKGNQ